MDNSHFNSTYSPYPQGSQPGLAPQNPTQQNSSSHNVASFGSLSAQGHQQSPQQASPSHPTLPPLQAQNGGFSFGALSYQQPGSQSQTPTTPHNPSMGANGQNVYSPAGAMLPPTFNQPYPMSQSMMYPPSTTTALPPTNSIGGLPTIRPMPPGGNGAGANGLPSLMNPGHPGQMGQQSTFMQNEEAPTHVVGSQGRRGILPSAPGRPNPPSQGAAGTKSLIPQKDADGKYPCPHCNKTYLHAKHLKRHLLRHTGDRPYMCHLCKDTFSRSDILKRHFQKCSLRRGNPTGANHLAHQRRNTNNANRLSLSTQDGPIGLANLPEVAGQSAYGSNNSPTVSGDMSARSSRANSLITPGALSQRNSLAGLGILGSNPTNGNQSASTASYQQGMYAMQHNTNDGAPMPPNFAFNGAPPLNGTVSNSSDNQEQMSFLDRPSSGFNNSQSNTTHRTMPSGDGSESQLAWNPPSNQGGQDGLIGSHPANPSSQGDNHVKTDQDSNLNFHMQQNIQDGSFLGSLYSHPSALGGEESNGSILGNAQWTTDDPLQSKIDSLRSHCFPGGIDAVQGDPAAELLKSCLSVDDLKHFAKHYTSYHGHWPILHMPTFRLTSANNNLVLAILCIGAVYSPKLTVHQVRLLMEYVKRVVFANSTIYHRVVNGQIQGLGTSSWDVEELQALSILQTLFTWHGNHNQRKLARAEFALLVDISKAMGLWQAAPLGHYAYSFLHSSRASQAVQPYDWSWHGWLEQEKRNRVLYQVFLMDAALALYFDCPSQLDPLEIRVSLPADDAAWDAATADDCCSALGLNGPHGLSGNRTGTRKAIQPSMRDAMRGLLEPQTTIQPGTTNVYSKFLLIHALILRIMAYQKVFFQLGGQSAGLNFSLHGSTPATPISQNDWPEQHGGSSGHNSGHGSPTDVSSPHPNQISAQQEKKRLGQAIDKWKHNWDTDMELQYPAQHAPQLRRFGFVRDGVHFFYLARSFLQSHQASDWTLPADARFQRVMALLKRIKSVVAGESREIGSVGDIDELYGVNNLTLDMKLLFRPHDSQFDSPVASVQTHA